MAQVAVPHHMHLKDEDVLTSPEVFVSHVARHRSLHSTPMLDANTNQAGSALHRAPHMWAWDLSALRHVADSMIWFCMAFQDLHRFFAPLTVGFSLFVQTVAIAKEPSRPAILTGPMLRKELDRPFAASWVREEFRAVLKQIESDRQITILLDRRIDPTSEHAIDIRDGTLRTGLTALANRANAEVSLLESGVFLGPSRAARQLRTLIELRTGELRLKEIGISDRLRTELLRHRTIRWSDLESPREILMEISRQFQLSITNLDSVAHDLWGAASISDAPAAEVISIVLIQLDLTFQWTDHGNAIELIPIPNAASVERKYRPKQKLTEAIAIVRRTFPNLDVQASNSEILIKGTVEEQEAIANLLRGEGSPRTVDPSGPRPIRERLFTFSVDRPVPIAAIMTKLEETGIHFEFDAQELQRAGIDLEKTVDLRQDKATADEFFKALFSTVGLEFRIDHLTIKLKPKSK